MMATPKQVIITIVSTLCRFMSLSFLKFIRITYCLSVFVSSVFVCLCLRLCLIVWEKIFKKRYKKTPSEITPRGLICYALNFSISLNKLVKSLFALVGLTNPNSPVFFPCLLSLVRLLSASIMNVLITINLTFISSIKLIAK